jgi:phospholipid/cholesterol/gamma-HCH transport system substrate-binding protein
MKRFSERNPFIIAGAGVTMIAAAVWLPLNYTNLPGLNPHRHYTAHFSEASGLKAGESVQVSGFAVGRVSSIDLDGNRVVIDFDVDRSIRLGDRTEAAVKTKGLLGTKFLEITPRGDGQLSEPIPLERTRPAYQLPDALGDLATTIAELDTHKLSDSWQVLAQTFQDTPPDLKIAVQGVARFSQTIDERDAQLRSLLKDANKVTAVLAERSNQVVGLVANTDALLSQLQTQSAALDDISHNISALAQQLSGFVADNSEQLRPALDKLNGVLTLVDNRKEQVQKSIKMLNAYAMSLGESTSAGPFFKSFLANLLPGQFVQPFVDAAFSDLGLDPNVLLPSERTDPQTGQPGSPALPVPYPRTGQGGEPNLTLPDAITGNPGDPRYPYREPLPAPPPGGPPPGPPALPPPAEGGQ